MWAHAMRFQWSISLAYKKFHLALEMLRSNALWQLVTILRTYFIASHTRPCKGQGCELIRGLQHCRRKSEKQLPVRANLQGKEVGDIFYLIESPPRNPWAAIGSLACLSSLATGADCHSAVSHGSTPQEANADDVVPTAAVGRGQQCYKVSSAQARVHIHPDKHWHYRASASKRKKRRHRRSAQRAEWPGEFPVEWSAEFPAECLAKC